MRDVLLGLLVLAWLPIACVGGEREGPAAAPAADGGAGGADLAAGPDAAHPDPADLDAPGDPDAQRPADAGAGDAGVERDGPLPGTDSDPPRDLAADSDGGSAPDTGPGLPWVEILAPGDGEVVDNPVLFRFGAGGGVDAVRFYADGDWPMHEDPIPAAAGEFLYRFGSANRVRDVTLAGFASGNRVASDVVSFTPVDPVPVGTSLPDQPGFNHYVVAAINDLATYPRDGTYRYCWGADWCGDMWGQIHGSWYLGQELFGGGGDCFCSGYTLELFFDAYRRWQVDQGVDPDLPFGDLEYGDARGGIFYQWWQGYDNDHGSPPAITSSSSAQAFEWAGIGEDISDDWDAAIPGDFMNISRDNGSGHAVVFVDWVRQGGTIVGLRYYSCNGNNSAGGGGGDSHPDPDHPDNTRSNSGPSFATEYLSGHGGGVIPRYVFIGRVFEPGGR